MKTWIFPLAADNTVKAEIRIEGDLTAEHLTTLHRYIDFIKQTVAGQVRPLETSYEDGTAVYVGDLVQLKPSADAVFGGLVLRVAAVDQYKIRGYFLTPHRGGCAEAWLGWKTCEVTRLGALRWPEAKWGFRQYVTPAIEQQLRQAATRPGRKTEPSREGQKHEKAPRKAAS